MGRGGTARLSLFAGAAALLAAPAAAFHSGGVAECVGCHSLHRPAAGGSFLLIATDPSSACLACHENAADTGPTSYHVSTATRSLGAGQSPLQRSPGGDFGWLKKTYDRPWWGRPIPPIEAGRAHGHNIIAADYGYVADDENRSAPGGSYPADALSCVSCHDPHGRFRRLQSGTVATSGTPIKASGSYPSTAANEPDALHAVGVYRLLAGDGYATQGVVFAGVPAAKVPSVYNRTEAVTQTRTAYGYATAGGHVSWGAWCSTCHPDMHASDNYVHPVDEALGATIAAAYGQYVKSGDLTGSPATSYSSLVPFTSGSADYLVLASLARNDDSLLAGPSSSDRVDCLTCHRAHAGGWTHALRWNIESEFMTYKGFYPGTDTTPSLEELHRGRTSAEAQAAYYDRPATRFATYQRVLCNKCHARD
jgi:hypothetical protein